MDSRLSLGKQLEHSLLAMSTAPQSLFFCREIRRFHGRKPFLCVTSPSMLVIHRYEIQQIFHSLKFPAEIFVRSSVERESVMNLSQFAELWTGVYYKHSGEQVSAGKLSL